MLFKGRKRGSDLNNKECVDAELQSTAEDKTIIDLLAEFSDMCMHLAS